MFAAHTHRPGWGLAGRGVAVLHAAAAKAQAQAVRAACGPTTAARHCAQMGEAVLAAQIAFAAVVGDRIEGKSTLTQAQRQVWCLACSVPCV